MVQATIFYGGINLGGHPANEENLREYISELDGHTLKEDGTINGPDNEYKITVTTNILAQIGISHFASLEGVIKARDNLNKGIDGLNLE